MAFPQLIHTNLVEDMSAYCTIKLIKHSFLWKQSSLGIARIPKLPLFEYKISIIIVNTLYGKLPIWTITWLVQTFSKIGNSNEKCSENAFVLHQMWNILKTMLETRNVCDMKCRWNFPYNLMLI